MRKVLVLVTNLLLAGCLLKLQSCAPQSPWEEESEALLRKTTALEDLHHQLNLRIDSLWDVTTDQLAGMMPSDFPSIDREIFLKARNADHMRMFMSFDLLSDDAQNLVIRRVGSISRKTNSSSHCRKAKI